MTSNKVFLKASVLAAALLISVSQAQAVISASDSAALERYDRSLSQILTGKSWQPAKPLIDSIYSSVVAMNDYVFDTDLSALKKNEIMKAGGKYYFKRENLVRLESRSSGPNNGAIVVRRKDGVVRGAGGGMLKFVKMTLEEDSRLLQLPNGYNVMKSDLKSLFGGLRSRLASGSVAEVTSLPIVDKNWNVPVKAVQVKSGNEITDRIFLDGRTNLPVEWDVYRDGQLISVMVVKEVKANVGLDDSLFEL